MKEKDWDYIAKVEKAISKKYGKETVQNPKASWDEEKEKEYIEQLKEMVAKEQLSEESTEKAEINGFLVTKKLLTKETNRKCPVCDNFSFKIKDDVYMLKFECCFNCYVKHVEDREERWFSGWRPKGENKCHK
jgi:hypothetical protein